VNDAERDLPAMAGAAQARLTEARRHGLWAAWAGWTFDGNGRIHLCPGAQPCSHGTAPEIGAGRRTCQRCLRLGDSTSWFPRAAGLTQLDPVELYSPRLGSVDFLKDFRNSRARNTPPSPDFAAATSALSSRDKPVVPGQVSAQPESCPQACADRGAYSSFRPATPLSVALVCARVERINLCGGRRAVNPVCLASQPLELALRQPTARRHTCASRARQTGR
jgi:hypothetical protein